MACKDAESVIVLSDGRRPILLREVNKYLALVAVGRENSYAKMPLIVENVGTTVEGLLKAFEITKQRK